MCKLQGLAAAAAPSIGGSIRVCTLPASRHCQRHSLLSPRVLSQSLSLSRIRLHHVCIVVARAISPSPCTRARGPFGKGPHDTRMARYVGEPVGWLVSLSWVRREICIRWVKSYADCPFKTLLGHKSYSFLSLVKFPRIYLHNMLCAHTFDIYSV